MFGSTNNTSSGGGGLFGSSNTASSTGGGGLFGANKPATTTTGFGSQPQQGSNLFGSSSNTGGGLFGNQQQQQQQQANTSGGLFGNKPATGGGLFGAQANNTSNTSGGGLFGGQTNNTTNNTGGGLFGGKTNNTANNTGGGLFGGQSNTTGTNTGGGLFGGQQQQQQQQQLNTTTSGGGLFGNKPATGGGLFGGSSTTANTGSTTFGSNQGTTGGLFGNKQPNTSGGLFGNTQQQQTQQPQQQQQQSSGLFSSNTTNNAQPSFSWSQPPQSSNSTATNGNTNQISNLTSGPFGSNTNQQVNNNTYTYTPAINDQLTKIWEQWDPNSSKCALKTYIYNKFSDQEINVLLTQPRPANESAEDWENAMIARPGPNYYPIKVNSFNDVAQRIETQLDYVAKSRVLLNNINQNLDNLSSQHDLENTTRIMKAKSRHTKLSRRLLRLATILAIVKLKGYPLLPEEEEISKQFELLTSKLNDPNSSIGKLSDVFARLAILKERAEEFNYQCENSVNLLNNTLIEGEESTSKKGSVTTAAEQSDSNIEEAIHKLSKVLLKQQMGLNYLNDILEKDIEAVNKISKK